MTSRISMVLNQAPNLRKPENLIQTFRNTSETFVSEVGNSLHQSGMIYRRVRLNEFHGILQNPWKSMIFCCFSLIFNDFRCFSLIFHQISEIWRENRTGNQEKSRFSKFQKIHSFYCTKVLCFFRSKSCYTPRVLNRPLIIDICTGYPSVHK